MPATGRKNPAAGPAPPPGGSQPIRRPEAEEDDNMEDRFYGDSGVDDDDDSDDDNDDDSIGNPLKGQGEDLLAGLLMGLVRKEDEAKAYLVIDEFVRRIYRIERRIEKLTEGQRAGERQSLQEAVREAVAKEVERAVGSLREEIRGIGKEVREAREALKKGSSRASGPDPGLRTWAEAIAGEPPKKAIPARLGREVLIRGITEPLLT